MYRIITFFEALGKRYYKLLRKLNYGTLLLMIFLAIYIRIQDGYYLIKQFNNFVNAFWFTMISVVSVTVILLIVLAYHFLKRGMTLKKGLVYSGIFMISPSITLIYSLFVDKMTSEVVGFFILSFITSLVLIFMSYSYERFFK